MTTAALKKKIIALVGQETNLDRLTRAYAALASEPGVAAEPETPYARILKAEADFRAGRFMSGDEARAKVKASLKRRRSGKGKAA